MVSIVVPVYNVEKYLACCLDSLLAQTYQDLEIILVDDGSTDSSMQICKSYQEKDSRIVFIHQENQGLASARNTGIRAAKGDYLYFVDSDDCIHVSLIELLVAIAEKEHAAMVQIAYEDVPTDFADFQKEIPGLENPPVHTYSATEGLYIIEQSKTRQQQILSLQTIVVWTKLYRVAAFDSLLFPEGMRLHEDQMVVHRNLIAAKGFVYVNLPMHYYRKAEASLIRVGWTPKRLAIFSCYEDRLDCLDAQPEEFPKKKELQNYIYERYLICIFRNYERAAHQLKGQEKKLVTKQIREKLRQTLKDARYQEYKKKLSLQKKCFFWIFQLMPGLVSWGYRLRR